MRENDFGEGMIEGVIGEEDIRPKEQLQRKKIERRH